MPLFLKSIYCHIFCIFVLLSVVVQFKRAPKHCAEVLSSVPELKKAVLHLVERTHVLNKLYSGMSYSAVGCEFSVTVSRICI